MRPLSLLCGLRIAVNSTQLACILTLHLRKVNATSQPRQWLEVWLLISQHI